LLQRKYNPVVPDPSNHLKYFAVCAAESRSSKEAESLLALSEPLESMMLEVTDHSSVIDGAESTQLFRSILIDYDWAPQ